MPYSKSYSYAVCSVGHVYISLGCGGYADDAAGAVSTTGHGESISKVCLAHHITNLMKSGRFIRAHMVP